MPARDILWEPGMTLPNERMNGLSCVLKGYGSPAPKLVSSSASTDEIATAVWEYMGTLSPDPTWGWQLGNPTDLQRVQSVLSRADVHWISYDPQGLYNDPMVATMVALFLCNLSALPEDQQYEATPQTDPDSWNWGSFDARRVYRWRVSVGWRNPRPLVRVEKLMQIQKLTRTGAKTPDGVDVLSWRIFNKSGQNQLYAYRPNSDDWYSGADFGDWLTTHATEIASALEAVAWALITAMTLGAGAGAAAGVTVVKVAAQVLKDAAIAAATGAPFDFGKFLGQLGTAAAALVQIPGVSELINSIGAWAKQAGETALRELLANGIFSSFLTSGGGFITNLTTSGMKLYSEVKGWAGSAQSALDVVNKLSNIAANPGQVNQLIAGVAPDQVKFLIDPLLLRLSKEIPDPKKLTAEALNLFRVASADLQRRIDTVKAEVANARNLLPDNLKPWFDFGARGQLKMAAAPFYAQAAVQLGQGASELQTVAITSMAAAKAGVDVQIDVLGMIQSYGLVERYNLLELLHQVAPRYAMK